MHVIDLYFLCIPFARSLRLQAQVGASVRDSIRIWLHMTKTRSCESWRLEVSGKGYRSMLRKLQNRKNRKEEAPEPPRGSPETPGNWVALDGESM